MDITTLNKSPKFTHLIDHIRQSVRKREKLKELQHMKVYSEHIKRCIHDNPLIGRALFQFYHIVKNFHAQNNRMNKKSSFDLKIFYEQI